MALNILTKKSKTKNGKVETNLRWWVSLVLSLALAVGTWNPTSHHFISYITDSDPLAGFNPFLILIVIALWIMAIKAIMQSLKLYGAVIAGMVILAFVWGLVQYDIIDTSSWQNLGWIVTISIGLIVWLGLNASIIWKRITGVYTTESTDDSDE